MAYSGLCQSMGDKLNVKEIGPYLLNALESDNDDLSRVACGLISDITSALGDGIKVHLTSFVPELFKVLRSGTHSRDSKLHCIQSIADLSLNAPLEYC